MPKTNNKIVFLVLLGSIFGLFGGLVGFLLANSYLLNSSFGLPFWGEVSIDQNRYSGANLVIRNAKKVVVEQDVKIKNTIDSVRPSLVGIYPRAPKPKSGLPLAAKYYYFLPRPPAMGLVLTNDGWLVTAWQPKSKQDLRHWVAVTAEKKIYSFDNFILDKRTGFCFAHIKASGLPVVQFSDQLDLAGHLAIIAKDWQQAAVNYFAALDKGGPVYSSDRPELTLAFSGPLPEQWANSFVFDVSGALVGLARQGQFSHIASLKPSLDSILRTGKIFWPQLGLKYILLPQMAADWELKQKKGALVVAVDKKAFAQTFGPAAEIGLKPGDIILSLNGLAVSAQQDIADILGQSLEGKKIIIEYERAGQKQEWQLKW